MKKTNKNTTNSTSIKDWAAYAALVAVTTATVEITKSAVAKVGTWIKIQAAKAPAAAKLDDLEDDDTDIIDLDEVKSEK